MAIKLVRQCREDAPLTPRSRRAKPQPAAPAEWMERGDGPVLGAHFLACLLKQHSELCLTDFAIAVLDAAAFDTPAGLSAALHFAIPIQIDNTQESGPHNQDMPDLSVLVE